MNPTRVNPTRLGLPLAVLLASVACTADEPPPKKVMPDGTIAQADKADQPLAELAKKVLADEIDVPLPDITVESIRPVEWRDGSLGCPQPDRSYAQVITPGHRIILRVDAQTYFVHEANGRAMVCRRSKSAASPTGTFEIPWAKAGVEARRDLAARLGVDEQLVVVAGATPLSWENASLGCPAAGVDYPPQRVDGFVLRLRHGSRQYTYHTDLDRVIPCPDFAQE